MAQTAQRYATYSDLADVASMINAQNSNDPEMYKMLNRLNMNLEAILKNGGSISQSRAGDIESERRFADSNDSIYQERIDRHKPYRGGSFTAKEAFSSFTDTLEEELLKGITGSNLSSMISHSLNEFADELGVELKDLPKGLGQLAGKYLANSFKQTRAGKDISEALNNVKSQLAENINNLFNKGTANVRAMRGMGNNAATREVVGNALQGASSNAGAVGSILQTAGQGTAQGNLLSGAGAAAKGAATKGLGTLGLYGLALIAILKVIDIALSKVTTAINEAKTSMKETQKAFETASNKYYESSKTLIKSTTDRVKADYESLITTPFKILEESAKSVQDAWDSTMSTITATQGYDKAGLQDLMSTFAQRLRSEGLTSVVSAADMTKNLAKVLESGLSGKIAEEFAYQATILNKAIPTEDFFSYASTYAAIAAGALQSGQFKGQTDAIEYATQQLKLFASNILYANRYVAGGFTTGLKDASQILSDSVKIVNTARSGSVADVSGVIANISAIVGSVAPDLTSAIVSNITSAATGGNAAAIASLRSLAGVGASNTDFIRALATDPKGVFSALFTRLAELQNMSNDNFMEVAEGLSGVFGVSMDAFARVDFNYLADAVSKMNTTDLALNENMKLLRDGQTTATAEQTRMQQINQYIIEEGLSYVLDNEVAQAVQQHLWQQEQTRILQESTYGVNLIGSTAETINSIYHVIETIVTILNPLMWGEKIGEVAASLIDYDSLSKDIDRVISAGAVGQGNVFEYSLLTNRSYLGTGTAFGKRVVDSYLQAITGTGSRYNNLSNIMQYQSAGLQLASGLYPSYSLLSSMFGDLLLNTLEGSSSVLPTSPDSEYGSFYTILGKSAASRLASSRLSSSYAYRSISAQSQVNARSQERMQSFLNSAQKFIEASPESSYEDWIKSAKNYGFSDVSSALEDYGLTENNLQEMFMRAQTAEGTKQLKAKEEAEKEFYARGSRFFTDDSGVTFQNFTSKLTSDMADMYNLQEKYLDKISASIDSYLQQWVDYYIRNIDYTSKTFNTQTVADIVNAEKSETGDAVLALANALTSNSLSIEGLNDPVVQQNVLLAQILKILESIMQQNNQTSTVSIPSALASLGLGLTNSPKY